MRLYRSLDSLPDQARGAALAIGNFDGLHRGHRAVIGEAVRAAGRLGVPAAVLTFTPHPRRFFKPDSPPFLLTRLSQRLRLFASFGLDLVYLQRFDAAFAALGAETFVRTVLGRRLGARQVIVGYDFVFGRGRTGDPELLRRETAALGIGVTILPPVAGTEGGPDAEPEGQIFSSTGLRDSLRAGDPEAAARILGRPFEIEGRVRRGDARGRTIGFPTANIWLGEYLRPAFGVYAVRAGLRRGGEWVWHDGVANLGLRPTVGGAEPRLEVHLLDFAGDLYGQGMRVQLIAFLRPEMRFDGLPALTAQIARDAERARERRRAPAAAAPRRL